MEQRVETGSEAAGAVGDGRDGRDGLGPRVIRSPQQWRALIEAQPASGLGVEDYCRQHRLTSSCFYRWRRFLAGGSQATSPEATSPWAGQKKSRPAPSPTGFATVTVLPQAMEADEPIRLQLAHGRQLLLPASLPMDRLAALVEALDGGRYGRDRSGS